MKLPAMMPIIAAAKTERKTLAANAGPSPEYNSATRAATSADWMIMTYCGMMRQAMERN